MFEVFCHAHGSRVLLDSSRIESVRNTPQGPVLDWRCWCGEHGSLVRGAHPRPVTTTPAHAA
jgi:hypothetical protein